MAQDHKLIKAYEQSRQCWAFYRALKPIDRRRLECELREIVNLQHDQVLVVDMRRVTTVTETDRLSFSPRACLALKAGC